MKKGVDGGYGKGTSIEIRVERITPMVRRLARPYFRVGIILSVCLSVCLRGGAVTFPIDRKYSCTVTVVLISNFHHRCLTLTDFLEECCF